MGQRSSGSILASPGCDRMVEGAAGERVVEEEVFGLITAGTVGVSVVAVVVVLVVVAAMLGVG